MDRMPTLQKWDEWAGVCIYNLYWHVSNKSSRQKIKLMGVLALLILIGTTDAVLFVRLARKMDGYEWFLSQVAITLAFSFISWPITWYQMYVSKTITPEIRNGTPLRMFAMLGMMDAMANMLGVLPLPYIPGPVVSILNKIAIPMLMLGSILYLRKRYQLTHYLGASAILSGVMINLIPFVLHSSSTLAGVPSHRWFWTILVVAAIVPAVASSLYKEHGLKDAPTNVWHFNSWVALFQLGWGAAMAWTVFVPMPAPATHIHPLEFPQYLIDSTACMLGLSSAPGVCQDTWAVFTVFIFFNVILNVLILYVYKRGSAVLEATAGTSTLALTNLAYHIPMIAGEAQARGISIYNLIALVVIVTGIIIYNIRSETTLPKKEKSVSTISEVEEGLTNESVDILEEETQFGIADSQDDEISPFVESTKYNQEGDGHPDYIELTPFNILGDSEKSSSISLNNKHE